LYQKIFPPAKYLFPKAKKDQQVLVALSFKLDSALFLGDAWLRFGFWRQVGHNFGDVVADGVSSFSLRIFKKIYTEIYTNVVKWHHIRKEEFIFSLSPFLLYWSIFNCPIIIIWGGDLEGRLF
jgi:hypothetical protein